MCNQVKESDADGVNNGGVIINVPWIDNRSIATEPCLLLEVIFNTKLHVK